MDYEKLYKESQILEQQEKLKLEEAKYYDSFTDVLESMSESDQKDRLSKLDERALFNSLSSQARKMKKALENTISSLEELLGKDGKGGPIALDAANPNNKNAQVFYQQLLGVYNQAKASLAKVTSPEFVNNYKTIDANTNIFGKTKGSMGISSKDINNATGGHF